MEDGSPWIAILITIVLVAINGMLASAEIAMMGLSGTKLQAAAQSGDKKARLLLTMKERPSDFLSTIQIGITLAGLLSGAFAADSLAAPIVAFAAEMGAAGTILTVIGGASTFLITLLMTFFMLVFGELVPKRIAMVRPEKTARGIVSLIHILSKVTRPLVCLLSVTTNGVLRLLRVEQGEAGERVTEEDILLMMREGQAQGEIEEQEVELLSNVFAFTDLDAERVMTHRTEIEDIEVTAMVGELIERMAETGHTKFPVTKEDIDEVVGVVYMKDIFPLYSKDGSIAKNSVSQYMRPPYFVFEKKPVDEIFADMKNSGEQLAVVVDDYGGTCGIITIMDIIQEIVGTVEKEETVCKNEDGSWTADGQTQFELLCDCLGLPAPKEDYDTLGGFMLDSLGYVPSRDQTPEVLYQGYRFQITQMDGALPRSVRIWRQTKAVAAEQ
ncbi:MAG: HlyC/CorC family transporter [Clostridiales bacterium]|jgi:putative hemolysin|nr:HlyC/CorC family transporter [Clostridiales bacterium]